MADIIRRRLAGYAKTKTKKKRIPPLVREGPEPKPPGSGGVDTSDLARQRASTIIFSSRPPPPPPRPKSQWPLAIAGGALVAMVGLLWFFAEDIRRAAEPEARPQRYTLDNLSSPRNRTPAAAAVPGGRALPTDDSFRATFNSNGGAASDPSSGTPAGNPGGSRGGASGGGGISGIAGDGQVRTNVQGERTVECDFAVQGIDNCLKQLQPEPARKQAAAP